MSAVETRDNCGIQTIQIKLFMYSLLINCKHLQTICNGKGNIVKKVYLNNYILQLKKTQIFFHMHYINFIIKNHIITKNC